MRALHSLGKRLLILSGVTLLGLGVWGLYQLWKVPQIPEEYIAPSVQIQESRLIGRQEGRRQWEILTQTVRQEGDIITLSNMEEIIVFQEEEPYFYVEADTAVWQRKADFLELKGGVTVTGKEQFRLNSEELVWQGRDETLTFPQPTVIQWDDITVNSLYTVAKVKDGVVALQEAVRIENKEFVWELKEALYDLDEEVLQFFGEAVLTMKGAENEEE